ncbi:2,5-dichloro-2,5-cyclohexadiene-1,4-diol dehydrogenase [Fusarium keratoplasticum]|uniref:2,5-dichloro-2,5-cyclohexadiene-1,4-diol dehydrogenase n=1 Tax=Fusarium keratoplasticum TaxID=1328300 RepID=A0ACC0QDX0_9HYPO|nr:2,5-dichloro-2,5-cyclohexadiene-1,4-diol dehydrogenase [Fusarium keratoplasticum]KAI8648216.1 2,5-dichloro-2,5-cyclohexadiene-1,4-diol dehydrogenase [Fusarium keratoplasticum]KAI8649017.1 2,5-dichloro-2,5-cyclohexadiene-1,4-diol dehydrogenase [Fusarium keratoplasticum]
MSREYDGKVASLPPETLTDEFKSKATYVKVDITDLSAVGKAVNDVVSWGGRLYYAVNAAGIFLDTARLADVTLSEFTQAINVNLGGAWNSMREEIRAFQRLKIKGSIVNITSDAGTVAMVDCSACVASKHTLVGLTKTAALEYAREGIRVNSVAPGDVATPMLADFGTDTGLDVDVLGSKHPIGRIGRPEEIAELICFLLSDRAQFMVGLNVAIDGGNTTSGYYILD